MNNKTFIGFFGFLSVICKNRGMNYLTVENISKSYGELNLFENISFSIHKDEKIAFVAKNGTGKTSLLNILTGNDEPDSGSITYRNGLKISYLSQEPELNPELTVEQTIFDNENQILSIIKNYEDALLNPDCTEVYQKAFEKMEINNAWSFETLYKQLLFKFKLENLQDKVSTLSGGQKKRLALVITLLNNPDLLILDEPTNHLDLEMIEWLEEFFKKEKITLFMVTHDRYFLERVCNEIIELDIGQLYTYKGNYSYYLIKKEERLAQETSEVDKAKQLYTKELDWIRRQPKARTTKSKSRIDDFQDIKHRAHQRRKEHIIQLEINMERLGNKIIELYNLSMSFGNKVILNKFNYGFKKGERVGIIGKNGTGKSTFLNLLTGSLHPESGKIIIGETVKFGYYTQEGIKIKQGQKVIEVIREYGDYIPLKKGRQVSAQQLLERFLFDRKKQYDFVEKLSGGELKRLYLCTVLIQNPNFLILDEPTNDLDIVTLNVLEQFLLDFPGCIIVVSHDRYFMDKIVDHLLVFRGDGNIEDFPGNYSDFRIYEDSKPPEIKSNFILNEKKNWKKDSNIQLSYNEQKEYKNIESRLRSLEFDKKKLEGEFNNTELTQEEINELSNKLQSIINEIDEKEERWFELTAKLED